MERSKRTVLIAVVGIVGLFAVLAVLIVVGALLFPDKVPILSSLFGGGRQIGTQDVWFFDSLRRYDSSGNATDITSEILEEAEKDLGPAVSLDEGFTFREARQLTGRVVDENGEVIPSISMTFGVLSVGPYEQLIAISSPNYGRELVNLDKNDFVDIELSFVEGLAVGDRAEMDYLFAQAIAPEDPSAERGLSDIEIFAQRWNSTGLYFTWIEADGQFKIAEIFNQPATVEQGSKFWRYLGKGLTVAGDTISGGLTGAFGGAATGVALGGGVGLLGGPFAGVTVTGGATAGGLIGFVVGGDLGALAGFLQSAGKALTENNPPETPTPVPTEPPTAAPSPTSRATPTPMATPTPRATDTPQAPPPPPKAEKVQVVMRAAGLTPEQEAQLWIAYLLDPQADWIYSIKGVSPEWLKAHADLRGHFGIRGALDQATSNELFGNTVFPCGYNQNGRLVVCAEDDAPAPEEGVFIVGMTLDGDIPLDDPDHFYTYAAVLDADGKKNNNFKAQAPYNWDYFQDTDLWYQLGWNPDEGKWFLSVTSPAQGIFVIFESGARAVVEGNAIVFFIPVSEVALESPGYRVTAFGHDGSYMPNVSGGDVSGSDPTEPLILISPEPFVLSAP